MSFEIANEPYTKTRYDENVRDDGIMFNEKFALSNFNLIKIFNP